MAFLKGGMPLFWVVVTSSTQQMWCPFAGLRQADGAAEACKDTNDTIVVGSAGLQPAIKIFHRLQCQPALGSTTQDGLFIPSGIRVHGGQALLQVLLLHG